MKLSSYEKKRIVYIAAAVIFILVCGIIYFGNEKKNEPSYEPVVESTVCETSFPYTDEGTGILLMTSRLLCMLPEPFYIPECMKSEAICVYRML